MYILYLLLALVILLTMVMIHEFGHYCAGKLLHFKINEFSIGFGKSIYSHKSKKSGEVFSLRLIPLGGYCAFEGEDEESDNRQSFNKQAPWKRLLVLFCGPFFNILSGVIFSLVLLCATGYDVPQIYKVESIPVISGVVIEDSSITSLEDSDKIMTINGDVIDAITPSSLSSAIKSYSLDKGKEDESYRINFYRDGNYYSANVNVSFKINSNLQKGDVIIKVNGVKIDYIKNNLFTELINKSSGESAVLTIKRNGKVQDVSVDLFDYGVKSGVKVIGVSSVAYKFSFGESLGRCVPFTFGLAGKILESFGQLITGKVAFSSVGGPVTTIMTIADYTKTNFSTFFILLPLIAVNLGVFNLFPIPALDGSKIVFVLIEWIRGKPINPKVENTICTVGFILLMAFVVIADIYHLFLA